MVGGGCGLKNEKGFPGLSLERERKVCGAMDAAAIGVACLVACELCHCDVKIHFVLPEFLNQLKPV